jgi:hypothetical protein
MRRQRWKIRIPYCDGWDDELNRFTYLLRGLFEDWDLGEMDIKQVHSCQR